MASTLLKIKQVTASSYSAQYRPELVLEDLPENPSSRWTGEYHRADHRLRGKPEWIRLELDTPAIIKTITFGKTTAPHPCNIDQFKVYGSSDDDADEMTLLLHSSLKNDEIPQTFSLKHTTNDGVIFPCKYIKVVPVTPFNQTYNMCIWHLALRGIDSSEIVERASKDYTNFRESVALRLILKHLRRRNSTVYQALLDETGLQIENPLISQLYEAFVIKGDHSKAESIFEACANADLIDLRLSNPSARPTTTWKRIWDTVNGPNDDPPPQPSPLSSTTPTTATTPVPPTTLTDFSSTTSALDPGQVPSPRGGHVSVLDRTHSTMYLFGGWDGNQDLSDFWAYSITSRRWTQLSPNVHDRDEGGPSARSCGAAVFDESTGYIYFLGRYVVRMSSAERRRMLAGAIAGASVGGSGSTGGSATGGTGGGTMGEDSTESSDDPPSFSSSRPRTSTGPMGSTPATTASAGRLSHAQRFARAITGEPANFGLPEGTGGTGAVDETGSGGPGVYDISSGMQSLISGSDSTMNSMILQWGPKSDFFRYATRGPNEGKWERLSVDTKVEGGMELTHDLAMAIDSENQILYAFGGQMYSTRRDNAKHYGSCCAYDIRKKQWKKLFSDSSSSRHRAIPSRDGHSMFFDPPTKRLYVVGGEQSGHSFENIWTFDTETGQVGEMAFPETSAKPGTLQMLRATADTNAREIYAISEVASSSPTHPRQDPDSTNTLVTLWIYNIDTNVWSPIIEPVRGRSVVPHPHGATGEAFPEDQVDEGKTREPRPRLGHSVVFDPSRQSFFVFGGNCGGGTRLNDLWSLTLNRPSVQEVIRKGKLHIRSQKFREMCETESSLSALQYLQLEVSTVVNHSDEEESAAFQRLLSILLSQPMSPISTTTTSLQWPLPHPTDNPREHKSSDADVEMQDEPLVSPSAPTIADGAGVGTGFATSPELHAQRLGAFDQLLTFVDPRAKQPKADIMDLVRSEL